MAYSPIGDATEATQPLERFNAGALYLAVAFIPIRKVSYPALPAIHSIHHGQCTLDKAAAGTGKTCRSLCRFDTESRQTVGQPQHRVERIRKVSVNTTIPIAVANQGRR